MLILVIAASCDGIFHRGNPRLARVNFRVLRLSDLHEAIGKNSSYQQREQFVENWVSRQLWEKEAKKHIRINAKMRRQIREYRRDLLIREYCDRYLRQGIHVSENDVLEYYREHQRAFTTPVRAVFAELYLCKNAESAAEVAQMLKDGETPPVAARRRLLRSGECVEALDKVLFGRNPGALPGPFDINGDYYVVSVRERYEENSLLRVEHVRDEIIQKLTIEAYLDAYQQKQKELKERSNVKIFQIPA